MTQPLSHLRKYNVILGSGSPRRKELMDIIWADYNIIVSEAEEIIPSDMKVDDVPAYLAELKADDLISQMPEDFLLVTADTIVIHQGDILGKPKDREEAITMVSRLAGTIHDVVSGVCVLSGKERYTFSDKTIVDIAPMSEGEIIYYVDNYQVMDKAGSYGIQDWLGVTKVTKLVGSYYTVMGLPVDKLYKHLKKF